MQSIVFLIELIFRRDKHKQNKSGRYILYHKLKCHSYLNRVSFLREKTILDIIKGSLSQSILEYVARIKLYNYIKN